MARIRAEGGGGAVWMVEPWQPRGDGYRARGAEPRVGHAASDDYRRAWSEARREHGLAWALSGPESERRILGDVAARKSELGCGAAQCRSPREARAKPSSRLRAAARPCSPQMAEGTSTSLATRQRREVPPGRIVDIVSRHGAMTSRSGGGARGCAMLRQEACSRSTTNRSKRSPDTRRGHGAIDSSSTTWVEARRRRRDATSI